jgi:hypothetical protein
MDDKDYEIIEFMEKYGGSFVKALAECLRRADPINYQKLKTAFSEYFMEYAKMAFGKKEEK